MNEIDAMADLDEAERGRWFWPALIVGWGLIAVGIVGMFSQRGSTQPFKLARYVIGFLLLHDLVVVPIVLVVAWVISRCVPPVARGPVRAALALSAIVVVFSWPLLRRFGEHATNDSALPLDYNRTVPVVVAVVWLVAAAVVLGRVVKRRRATSAGDAASSAGRVEPAADPLDR